MPLAIAGVGGEVRWGYHRAAVLERWTLTASPTGQVLAGTIAQINAAAVSQRPLAFVVPRPQGVVWRWSVVSLQVSEDARTLTAQLAETEE